MKKILIAMESSICAQQLEQQLSGLYHVISCCDGLDGAVIIKDFDPDVLVLDLMLPGIDGIGLLEHAWNSGYRPKVIAITPNISDYVVTKLERMNVSCLLRSPSKICQLVTRIMDVAHAEEEDARQGRELTKLLASLSFKMNTTGYRITLLALEIFSRNPKQKITSELYSAVAAACNGTVTQVEKAIRDSIDSAWKDRNEPVWRMYFASGKNGKTIKPSNGEFLARICQCIADSEDTQCRKIG